MWTCLVLPKHMFPLLRLPAAWPQQRSAVLAQRGQCCRNISCTAHPSPVGGALTSTHTGTCSDPLTVDWQLRRPLAHMDIMDMLVCCNGGFKEVFSLGCAYMISTQKLDVIATSCHAKALWVNIKNLNCAQHVPVIAFRSVDQILSFKVKN